MSHGNATKPESKKREFVPSNPSTNEAIRSEAKETKDAPIVHHAKLLSGDEPERYPRDLVQVQNYHKAAKRKSRLHHDSLFTLVEMYHELAFISDINLAPTLTVICYLSGMLV